MECIDQDLHIILVAWKGISSVRAYMAKTERIHYLRLCGADFTKFGNFSNSLWYPYFPNNIFIILLKRSISLQIKTVKPRLIS